MNYSEMVRKLAKNGKDALATMTPLKIHVWHMSSCLMGEAGELIAGEMDQENVVEELGDLEFYMEGLRDGLDINRDEILRGLPYCMDRQPVLVYPIGIIVESCNVFDACKKWIIYEKDIDIDKLLGTMQRWEYYMGCFRGSRDLKYEDILKGNMFKLAKRYGATYDYSNAAAQNRADKQS